VAIAGLAVAATTLGVLSGFAAPAQAAAPTIVSLTFDDGNADQVAAAQTINGKGLLGTFFIISGYVGQPGYLTQTDVANIAGSGNEIGGHTVHHLDLTTLTADDATREICNDRVNLSNWGYNVTDFAYPYASLNPAVESIVQGCGYNSARGLGDLKTAPGTDCAECANAETIPPADPYDTAAADQVDSTWTLAQLEARVTDAEAEGGWVQLTFHHICDGCGNGADDPTIDPALFDQFTTWLAGWQDGTTKKVEPVNQVIGGPVQPLVNGPALTPPPGPGQNGSQNPSLETPGTVVDMPQCWWGSSFGTNSPTFTTVSPGHTGNVAEKVTMTNYVDGDAKLLALFDDSGCSPSVSPGATYSLRAFYESTANTQFAIYTRNSLGVWSYWDSSPLFPPSATWVQANYTTLTIPADVTGISFGLNITANGELTTDDYGMYDTNGAPLLSLSAATPTITGTAQVGQALTADPGTWAPVAVSFAYQWLADGTAISGATLPSYTPVAGDVGKAITVQVTGTAAGYDPLTATSAATAAVTPVVVDPTVVRIGGADRYETSAMTSAATFAPGVPVVYIASGAQFPDALSGSAAAGVQGGPVLLVQQNAIPDSITAELQRLQPAKIVVLGGSSSISDSVVATLGGIAPTTRISGSDRYDTSAQISAATFSPGVPVAYVASGEVFPDALSGAAAAGKLGGPVLLVGSGGISAPVAAELDRLKPAKIVVLGGSSRISDSTVTALGAYGPASRVAGADRFGTSALISAGVFASPVPVVYIAAGANFPDALSGSAAAIAKGGPVLLVSGDQIPADVSTELQRLHPAKIVVLGGSSTVPDSVLTALQRYIG
jgi:putative cell wall-binding protein/peptidoglycan/xylan/chitin deacetylase (PgdA/CDA1 family)